MINQSSSISPSVSISIPFPSFSWPWLDLPFRRGPETALRMGVKIFVPGMENLTTFLMRFSPLWIGFLSYEWRQLSSWNPKKARKTHTLKAYGFRFASMTIMIEILTVMVVMMMMIMIIVLTAPLLLLLKNGSTNNNNNKDSDDNNINNTSIQQQ